MTKVLNSKNGFAQDALRMFTISDRTHQSTLTYFIETQFIGDIDYNIKGKQHKVESLNDAKLQHFIDHKEQGIVLDNDFILQCDRDIDWQTHQIELAEILKAYLQQAVEQLVPEQIEKSKQVASSIKDLETMYKQRKAS